MLKTQSWFPEIPGAAAEEATIQPALRMDRRTARTGRSLTGVTTELRQNPIFRGFSKKKKIISTMFSLWLTTTKMFGFRSF